MWFATSTSSEYLMRIKCTHLNVKLGYTSRMIKMCLNDIFDKYYCAVSVILLCVYSYHQPCWNLICYHINNDD